MRSHPVPEEAAHKIWDILIEHAGCYDPKTDGEAHDHTRDSFVRFASEGKWVEWRFQGSLGFGGKVYFANGHWYVTCYREDETPERLKAIEKTNAALDKLFEETYGEPPRKR